VPEYTVQLEISKIYINFQEKLMKMRSAVFWIVTTVYAGVCQREPCTKCYHVVTRDLGFSMDLKRKCSMLIRAEGCCDSYGAHNGGLMRSGNLKSIKHNSECQAEYDESGSDRLCPLDYTPESCAICSCSGNACNETMIEPVIPEGVIFRSESYIDDLIENANADSLTQPKFFVIFIILALLVGCSIFALITKRQKSKSKKKQKSKEGNTRMMTSIIGSTGVHIVDINSNAENQHLKSPS